MNSRTKLKPWVVMAIFLAAVAILSANDFATGTYDDGDGSAGDPFQINTPAQMDEIGQHTEDWDKCFILMADIDLSGYTGTDFHIIGNDANEFTGVFDGNDHTISNFTYTSIPLDTWHIGLFGYVGTGGEIKKLGLLNVNVDAETGIIVGGLVGRNEGGTVSRCYATGSVTGDYGVGGLVGYNDYGTVSNCYAAVTVMGDYAVGGLMGFNSSTVLKCYARGNVTGGVHVGGLIGAMELGTVSKCYARGNVTGDGNVGGLIGTNDGYCTVSKCYARGNVTGGDYAGGLVGHNSGTDTVSNCSATGDVTGDYYYVGGLMGSNEGTVSNCCATGDVTGGETVGGLVGWNAGTVSNCYATTGDVTGDGAVGGLAGHNTYGIISNCYACVNVTGTGSPVGGLVGWNYESTVSNCYASGNVTGDSQVGGLVGWNICLLDEDTQYTAGIFASFWDTQTTGQGNGVGDNEGSGTVEVYGRTTAEMKTQSTFGDYGWDFVEIWGIGENQTYPYLMVYPAGDLNHDGWVDFRDFAIFANHWLTGM